MNKPIRILTAILASLAIGGMFAYQDAQKNEPTYQQHPVTVILTNFFCGSLVGLIFYFGSGWLARRKERKFEKAGDLKFYEEVACELQDKPMDSGLWTKAFAEMGGDDAKARALYIKYRVAQLTEASRQKLEKERHTKQRQEEQKNSASKAAEQQRLALIETGKRQARTRSHRFTYMLLTGFCALNTISFGFFGVGAPLVQDNTFEEKIYLPIVWLIVAFCFGVATRHCYKEMQ